MWGIIPAAGAGSRIQPLAFSKELLPGGSWLVDGPERPQAVSEYLIGRMIAAGLDKICFVISSGKSDILSYYGGEIQGRHLAYVVPPGPWFPEDGLSHLPDDVLSFLLFPMERPEFFDAVVTSSDGTVREIQAKQPRPHSSWVWGAFTMFGKVLYDLAKLWQQPGRNDASL